MEYIKKQFDSVNYYLVRLPFGGDLLETVTAFLKQENIQSGIITGIGALQSVSIGFYDQETKKYSSKTYDQPMEILNITGNISIKDNEIFPHLHITAADNEHKTMGGHLFSPSIIFACEISIIISDYKNVFLQRGFDEVTGLALWQE